MRPRFHVAAAGGWVNDPNGPLYFRGRYHLFYQTLPPPTTSWTWGLSWGHAVSPDLVHWRRLPHALSPTPGGPDADGCFSGCATLDDSGRPTLLYTGVVRRPDAPPDLTPNSFTVTRLCVERQLMATAADPDDPDLREWIKHFNPWLEAPPPGLPVNCWRDPVIIKRPPSTADATTTTADPSATATSNPPAGPTGSRGLWRVAIGSGVDDAPHPDGSPGPRARGMALLYSTDRLPGGEWRLEPQPLFEARRPCDGAVWECPLLAPLAPLQQPAAPAAGGDGSAPPEPEPRPPTHMFSASVGRSPALGWLGRYADGRFTPTAVPFTEAPPLPLDHGDLFYAPQHLQDPCTGRSLIWGWLSELRAPTTPGPTGSSPPTSTEAVLGSCNDDAGGFAPSASIDYAGCISLPRVLALARDTALRGGEGADACSGPASAGGGWYLHSSPLPELSALRTGHSWVLPTPSSSDGSSSLRANSPGDGGCVVLKPGAPPLVVAGLQELSGPVPPFFDLGLSATPSPDLALNPGAPTGSSLALGHGIALLIAGPQPPPLQAQGALIGYDFASCRLIALLGPAAALPPAFQAWLLFTSGSDSSGGKTAGADGGCCCWVPPVGIRVLSGERLQGAAPGKPLELRAFLDWSVLEVFTATGQALATRAYLVPSAPAAGGSAGAGGTGAGVSAMAAGGGEGGVTVGVGAVGGRAAVRVVVHEMGSAWDK